MCMAEILIKMKITFKNQEINLMLIQLNVRK